jgi:tRNA(Leu) C34 or U34 (ribose-2'-O)-methylase TrmL
MNPADNGRVLTVEGPEVVTPRLAGGPFLVFDRRHTTPITPAVVLERPKNALDVALVLQTCRAFGIPQVWISGARVALDPTGPRPPYEDVTSASAYVSVVVDADPVTAYQGRAGTRIIAVERGVIGRPVWPLGRLPHPDAAVYVFGPEDGHISTATLDRADAILEIPSRFALNLVAAVGIVLGDRTRQFPDPERDPEGTR